MEQNFKNDASQPRRKFLVAFLTGLAGLAALPAIFKRARASTKKTFVSAAGPILYHRNEETERYYKTLYR